MADENNNGEEVIELSEDEDLFAEGEGEEEGGEQAPSGPTPEEEEEAREKRRKLVGIGIFLLSLILLLTFFAVLFLLTTPEETPQQEEAGLLEQAAEKIRTDKIIEEDLKKSDIEKLIVKANLLYQKGEKEESLEIFNRIALFNESLSWYNVGVARLREKDTKGALEAFQQALKNEEHRCQSAVNAAVCARSLGDDKLFRYYIDLAYAYLPATTEAPLYSFYYALIHYYRNEPYKALAALSRPTSGHFMAIQDTLAARIHVMLDDSYGAIERMEKNRKPGELLALGLLYARVGEYALARERLAEAIKEGLEPVKSTVGLILCDLKAGLFGEASKLLQGLEGKADITKVYPIKATLKERLFDVDLAQEHFSRKILLDNEVLYSVLFYNAPYQVFKPDRTIAQIRKGQASLSNDDINTAKGYLGGSVALAGTNAKISLAVKLALNNHTVPAHEIFKRLAAGFPNHDVLQYNLALSYAQMGDYANARYHFERAYFLNGKNTLAGVFYGLCLELMGEEPDKLVKDLTGSLEEKRNSDVRSAFYLSLLHYKDANVAYAARWLEQEKEETPMYVLLDLFVADRLQRHRELEKAAARLEALEPDDLLTAMLALYAKNRTQTVKKFSFNAQLFMSELRHDREPLFYGPAVVRELYVKLGLVTGNLPKIRTLFKERLAVEKDDPSGLLQGLALTDIYLRNFEEAFQLYNQLIDVEGRKESKVLLNAAIAAIGAGHKENAIVLLELARLENKKNYEARYGLGLLYQEVKNFRGAAIQYGLIQEEPYESAYFDFRLKTVEEMEEEETGFPGLM